MKILRIFLILFLIIVALYPYIITHSQSEKSITIDSIYVDQKAYNIITYIGKERTIYQCTKEHWHFDKTINTPLKETKDTYRYFIVSANYKGDLIHGNLFTSFRCNNGIFPTGNELRQEFERLFTKKEKGKGRMNYVITSIYEMRDSIDYNNFESSTIK